MNYPRGSLLSNAWLVTLGSLSTLAILILLLASPWEGSRGRDKTLVMYCAAGMSIPVSNIIHEYEEQYGVIVQANYDGTGKLLAGIRAAGGRGDLFLSADADLMRRARKEGLVREIIPLALVQPVLVVNRRTQERLQGNGQAVAGLNDLGRDDLLAVLASEGASIGRTSRAILKAAGMWDRFAKEKARLHEAGTVNEVAQTVALTENTMGLVWDAVGRQFKDLVIIALPAAESFSQHYEIGVLANCPRPAAALHFARFLTAADRGMRIIAHYHFRPVPDADLWEDVPHLHLAAEAKLEPGLRDVVQEFSRREGVRIDTNYAECDILVSRMKSIKLGRQKGPFPEAFVAGDIRCAEQVRPWFEAPTVILKNRLVFSIARASQHHYLVRRLLEAILLPENLERFHIVDK